MIATIVSYLLTAKLTILHNFAVQTATYYLLIPLSTWLTDTGYNNIQLETLEGKYPVYLGLCLFHFRKDAFTFNWFFREMCSFDQRVQKLKVIGTDQNMTIYDGFAMDNVKLKLLLCVYHLEKSDRQKLSKLNPKYNP